MDTTELVTRELDRSIGDGPAHRPVEERIAAGRRIVVRRRLTAGAGATAAALVIGSTAWAMAPTGDLPVAERPSTSTPDASEKPADAGGEIDPNFPERIGRYDEAAFRDPRGKLHVAPGWTVTDRIDHPTGRGSLAVEVSRDGRKQWFHWGTRDGVYAFAPQADAVDDAETLAQFVASDQGPAPEKQCLIDGTCTEDEVRGSGEGER
jgi:hypothetical protein